MPLNSPKEYDGKTCAEWKAAQLAALPPQPDLRAALVEAKKALDNISESIMTTAYGQPLPVYFDKPATEMVRAALARIDAVLEVKP
jgi:hypothetical protein